MKYIVQWKETHEFIYCTTVEADSAAEAKQKANSHDWDDNRMNEFTRVISVGRKKATPEDEV